MSNSPASQASTTPNRREFLKTTSAIAAASALAGVNVPHVYAAEDNTIRVALVGCGGRGTGAAVNALVHHARARSSSSRWPTSSRTASSRVYDNLKEQPQATRSTCPTDRKFVGFDGYQKAMDCLKPRRRRHPGHAAGLPLGPLPATPSRRASTSSWRSRSPSTARARKRMLELGEESLEQEPEGRRRPDVPALRRAAGAVRPHQDGPDRRRHRSCAPTACTARSPRASSRKNRRADVRAAVPDPELPRVPVGVGRAVQRLPHPQHRRVLLDEGRLAGQGQGASAAGTTAATTSTRTSTPTPSSTPSPTAPSSSSRAAASTAATTSSPATPTAPRARPSSPPTATPPPSCKICAGQDMTTHARSGPSHGREPNPYQLEWDHLIDAIRKDKPLQRSPPRRRGEPGHQHGPHGRPHRPGHHVRPDAQLRARVRAGRRQADDGRPAPLLTDKRRQVPGPAAGHQDDAGVLDRSREPRMTR